MTGGGGLGGFGDEVELDDDRLAASASSAIMIAAMPPADAAPVAPGDALPGGGAARHTQPTLSAMITSESRAIPTSVHNRAHLGAESRETEPKVVTPTGADRQAANATNESSATTKRSMASHPNQARLLTKHVS